MKMISGYKGLTKKERKKTLGLRESSQGKNKMQESESSPRLGFRLIGEDVVAAPWLAEKLAGSSQARAGPQSEGCWRKALGSCLLGVLLD